MPWALRERRCLPQEHLQWESHLIAGVEQSAFYYYSSRSHFTQFLDVLDLICLSQMKAAVPKIAKMIRAVNPSNWGEGEPST